jgi:serine phosphatase RsbU (regulator of sigma subunit)
MPDPLLITGESVQTLSFRGERLPLGAMKATRYESTRAQLAPGARLLLFSDGLPEAMVGSGLLGYDRVEEMAARSRSTDDLLRAVRALPELKIDDDLTLVMLERK